MIEFTDSERLDFLQSTHRTIYRVVHNERKYRTTVENTYDIVEVFDGWSVSGSFDECDTIRKAIDKAIIEAAE